MASFSEIAGRMESVVLGNKAVPMPSPHSVPRNPILRLHPSLNFVNNTVSQIVGPHSGHHRYCEYNDTDPARRHSLLPQLSYFFVSCFEQPNNFHDRPDV